MNSSDMGPAMALDGAKLGAVREALRKMAAAAETTAETVEKAGQELRDPYDRTVVLNDAIGWRQFAVELRKAAA